MGEMQMPIPENTLPMMTGQGQFGPIEMGGMFTTLKVRKGLAKHDYKDPGAYKQPKGSAAYEWTGKDEVIPVATKAPNMADIPMKDETVLKVRKSGGHMEH